MRSTWLPHNPHVANWECRRSCAFIRWSVCFETAEASDVMDWALATSASRGSACFADMASIVIPATGAHGASQLRSWQ